MKTRTIATAAATTAVLAISACVLPGSDATSDSPDQPSGMQESPATSTFPGTPRVTFDPCTAIDDATLLGFGLDPNTKSRNDTRVGDRAVVACNILGNERAVGFIAQNTPWEDIPLTAPAESITVNTREGLYIPDSLTDDACALLLRTDFGAVVIDTFPMRRGGSDPNMHACDGIVEMAEAIEPLIQDGT